MEPEKIKPKASRIAPDLPIGNEGTKGSSIAPRATGPGGGASRLTRVRRIERNSSWVKVGAPDKAAFGTFQRVDPKYALIKELEWKLAQPSHPLSRARSSLRRIISESACWASQVD